MLIKLQTKTILHVYHIKMKIILNIINTGEPSCYNTKLYSGMPCKVRWGNINNLVIKWGAGVIISTVNI